MELLRDMALNLLAEGIGIIVTVFWIDRLLKKREEKRWKPDKFLIYLKLVSFADDLLGYVMPKEYININPRHGSN